MQYFEIQVQLLLIHVSLGFRTTYFSLMVNPFFLWLFLLVVDLWAFVVSVVVDCTKS